MVEKEETSGNASDPVLLRGIEKIVIYNTALSCSYTKQNNCPTIWKNCRFPDFQKFCKFNHKPGIGLGKNVIYSTILKQVLQEKKRKTHSLRLYNNAEKIQDIRLFSFLMSQCLMVQNTLLKSSVRYQMCCRDWDLPSLE